MMFLKMMKTMATILALGLVPVMGSEDDPCYTDDGFFFWKLGHMDGPHVDSRALGISRDGKVVLGRNVFIGTPLAFRIDVAWTLGSCVRVEGDPGCPPLYNELQVQEGLRVSSLPSAAYAASDMTYDPVDYEKYEPKDVGDPEQNLDWGGSTVVGTYRQGMNSYAVNWQSEVWSDEAQADKLEGVDYVSIQDFGGGIRSMAAYDISADGTRYVGTGNVMKGEVAFLALLNKEVPDVITAEVGQLTIVNDVDGISLKSSSAKAISADGKFIAGYGSLGKRGNRAFVSEVVSAGNDPETGVFAVTLNSAILPVFDGGKWAKASALTWNEDDGAVIVGTTDSPQGPQACIWFFDEAAVVPGWQVKPLGSLAHKLVDSAATGIAYVPGSEAGDYLVIGHSASIQESSEAFVWAGNLVDEDPPVFGYTRDLEYILTKTGAGADSGMGSDWILVDATGISADGTRIVGWGTNPEGGTEAWLVDNYPSMINVFTDCIDAPERTRERKMLRQG